jgi:hypothetical protein
MGCDIHGPFVYGKKSLRTTAWWDRIATLDWGRDYCAFAYLADVRNDGSHAPIDGPRGQHPAWGGAVSYNFREVREEPHDGDYCDHYHEHRYSPDCHSLSWLTTDELVEAQIRYAAHTHTGAGWDDPRPSSDFGIAIAIMRTAEMEGYTDVHIGFCFDN